MKGLGLLALFCLSSVSFAFAQSANDPYSVTATYIADAAQSNLPKVDGVVRRINVATQEITLKHDEIPNLEMGAMTMTFAVPDESMLQGLTRGDQVKFQADEINGVLTLVWIEKQ